ncbi:hypothetical protein ACFWIN_30425, partial [Streptomyces sp. NPDC127049]
PPLAARRLPPPAAPGGGGGGRAPRDPLPPVTLDARFHRYVELDEPCWIEAEILTGLDRDATTVQILAHQGGEAVLDCTLAAPHRARAGAGATYAPALRAG